VDALGQWLATEKSSKVVVFLGYKDLSAVCRNLKHVFVCCRAETSVVLEDFWNLPMEWFKHNANDFSLHPAFNFKLRCKFLLVKFRSSVPHQVQFRLLLFLQILKYEFKCLPTVDYWLLAIRLLLDHNVLKSEHLVTNVIADLVGLFAAIKPEFLA